MSERFIGDDVAERVMADQAILEAAQHILAIAATDIQDENNSYFKGSFND